jgi:hypothetical protein
MIYKISFTDNFERDLLGFYNVVSSNLRDDEDVIDAMEQGVLFEFHLLLEDLQDAKNTLNAREYRAYLDLIKGHQVHITEDSIEFDSWDTFQDLCEWKGMNNTLYKDDLQWMVAGEILVYEEIPEIHEVADDNG